MSAPRMNHHHDALRLIVVAATALTASACSTTAHHAASSEVDGDGMSTFEMRVAELDSHAYALKKASFDEFRAMTTFLRKDPDLDQQIDITYENVSQGVVIKYKHESPIGFFAPGDFDVTRITQTSDRGGATYAYMVNNSVRKLVEQADQLGVPVCLEARYTAGADGLPTSVRSIYKGELGDHVSLTKTNTMLNGVPADISIRNGQRFDNPQLAALRAVSMRNSFRAGVREHKVRETFDLKVSRSAGSTHRFVQFSVLIRTDGAECGQ